MPAAWPTRVHDALLMSEAVPRRIALATRSQPRVQAVYRSVVNVATSDGLLTLATPDSGALPNGIQVDIGSDWRTLGIRAGMAVEVGTGHVRVPEADLEIGLDTARRWSPRFRFSDEAARGASERWRTRRSWTWIDAASWASEGGLGPLLRREGDLRHRPGVQGVSEVAGPIVQALNLALEAGDRHAAAVAAVGLVGLGPGLTPSGDDALVGMEAALHALRSPMAGFTVGALHDVTDRTTEVAATLLRHAAAGETSERVHELVAALVGSDGSAVSSALARAVAWGATSGTDCLLGVLVGLDVAAGPRGSRH